jgi:chemotaxis protein CheZ
MDEKRFRIERGSAGQRTGVRASEPHAGIAVDPAARNRAPLPRKNDAAPLRELRRLQGELHAMKDAIAATKREISSIQHSATGRRGMHRAAGELDAVAAATERATTTILGAVEDIEGAANLLRSSELEGGRSDYVSTILERVVLLYETCNFQDLTGQRITKVVSTLKFVEERLDTMILAWGASHDAAEAALHDASTGLINGPGLPGDEQVSQTDIDAFFRE